MHIYLGCVFQVSGSCAKTYTASEGVVTYSMPFACTWDVIFVLRENHVSVTSERTIEKHH